MRPAAQEHPTRKPRFKINFSRATTGEQRATTDYWRASYQDQLLEEPTQ